MSGVSVGSILTNVFVQLIILLYLLDQSEESECQHASTQCSISC